MKSVNCIMLLLSLLSGITVGSVRIEAEDYTAMSGIQVEACGEGGENIGYIHDGDWARYVVDIPVAGDYQVLFRVASRTNGGSIDLLLEQHVIGRVTVGNTGHWQAWTTVSTTVMISQVGVQTLQLNCVGGSGYLFNINWIELAPPKTTDPDTVIRLNSIPQLIAATQLSNLHFKMEPGHYYIDQDDQASGRFPNEVLFDFGGSHSTYDFTDVTLNVHTNIYDEYGNVSVVVVDVTGSGNHLFGLTINDIGNERPYRSACGMYVTGDNNKIEEISFYIRGSKPYAYGDLFGKGSGYIIKHWKHSALLVTGTSNHILNCYVEMHAYGHGIFMQGSVDTLIEGCFVKGFTRTTDEVLAERSGPAHAVDFMTVWGWPVPLGYAFSLSEDGIRCYNSGANGRDTANTTVKNCTVDGMRGGVTIGFSNGRNVISGCTVIGGESNFWPGDGDTVEHCQGEAPYAALINHPYQGDDHQDMSITVLRETDVYGNEQLAYVAGHSHNITLWNSSIQPRPFQQTIQMSGLKKGMRYMEIVEGRNDYALEKTTLTNWMDMPVRLGPKSSDCTVSSFGPVTDLGRRNTEKAISPVTITASGGLSTRYHTVDGDLETYWSVRSRSMWIQYDLGHSRNLYAVLIKWFKGATRQYYFDLMTASSPNGPWTTVFSGASQGLSGDFEYVDFKTQNARYIRVVGRGNSVDSSMNIVDFDVDLKDRFALVKSKSDDGHVAQNTLDGDLNTRWSARGLEPWIQYDLLNPRTVLALSLAWYRGDTRTSDFDIQTADHPMGPWTTAYSGSSSGTTIELEEYPFTPIRARFIRVTAYGESSHSTNGITEVFIDSDWR